MVGGKYREDTLPCEIPAVRISNKRTRTQTFAKIINNPQSEGGERRERCEIDAFSTKLQVTSAGKTDSCTTLESTGRICYRREKQNLCCFRQSASNSNGFRTNLPENNRISGEFDSPESEQPSKKIANC